MFLCQILLSDAHTATGHPWLVLEVLRATACRATDAPYVLVIDYE